MCDGKQRSSGAGHYARHCEKAVSAQARPEAAEQKRCSDGCRADGAEQHAIERCAARDLAIRHEG